MRLTAGASLLLAGAGLGVLAIYGGSWPWARTLYACVAGAALLLAAMGMGRRFRVPPLGWIVAVFGPPAALCLLQSMPLGWTHPWVAQDCRLLGVVAPAWSIEPAATHAALLWTLALAATALVWHCHARGERARPLAYALLGVAVAHAAVAIVLALSGSDFPSHLDGGFVVRGCFIYYNHAAAFSACCLPLAVLIAKELKSPWGWIGVGALALAVVLSTSRGGTLVAGAVVLPLAWSELPRRRRLWWFGALVGSICAYFVAIGLHEIGAKFSRLIGPEGLTLDGRIIIWGKTLPLIAQASPLGSGAGTTEFVWWRTACEDFPGRMVNHIHSDPLEWALEYGWAGALALVAGAATAVALLWKRKPADPTMYWGGVLGLLILAVHSCADFIWNREAIAIAAVVLAILVCEGRGAHDERSVRSTRGVRAVCLALAIAIAACLPRAWHESGERADVAKLQDWIDTHVREGLPINGRPTEDMLQREPSTVACAVEQARLDLDLPGDAQDRAEREIDAAKRLAIAAQLAPGDPGAWVERARLAALDPGRHPHELSIDVQQVLSWSPTWVYAQARLLDCDRVAGINALEPAVRAKLARGLLEVDQPEPAWFFPVAQAVLGRDELASRLSATENDTLARSGMDWLARHADEQQWLARWRKLLPSRVDLDPCQAPLAHQMSAPGREIHLNLAMTADDRRGQAEAVQRAGEQMPYELADALRHDGMPYALWAAPVRLQDPGTADQVVAALHSQLFHGWARGWYEDALDARAAAGDLLRLGSRADPELVSSVLAQGQGDPSDRSRLEAILAALERPHWQLLPGGHWTWIRVSPAQAAVPLARLPSWEGLVVDGEWAGWRRGMLTSADLPSGLHRLALLEPLLW